MGRTIYPLHRDVPRVFPRAKQPSPQKRGRFYAAPLRVVRALFARVSVLRPHLGLAIIATTLVIGSQATLIWVPRVGLFVDVVGFVLLLVLSLVREAARPILISLAVLPVANLVSSSFITHSVLARTTILYVTLLVLAQLYRYFFSLDAPLTATKLGARGYGFALPAMVIVGEALGLIGYGFLRHHYMFSHVSLPLIAVLSFAFAFCEEVFLRGLVQQQAAKLFHPGIAAAITATLYIFLSLDHHTLLTLGPAIFTGVVLAVTYYKKQNLILTVTINAAAKLTYIGLLATFIIK